MGTRLYVGNLSYSTTDGELRDAFAAFGEVVNATVVLDRMTGKSRGFGFVEMASDAEAQAATEGMNGANVDGRALVVNEAREKTERGGGGGFGGRDRGPRRGGGGGGGGEGGWQGGGGGGGGGRRGR